MKKESSDKMLNKLEGIVIAPNHLKKEILKNISKTNTLINIKIMTKEEFLQNYYGTYKKEALYFIMKKFNLNYLTAKTYLDHIFVNSKTIKPYYETLKQETF